MLDITIFNNSFSAERDCECQILLCWMLFAFRGKNKSLILECYLKMFWLIYMHVTSCEQKTLHACYMHACHCAHDFWSPEYCCIRYLSTVTYYIIDFIGVSFIHVSSKESKHCLLTYTLNDNLNATQYLELTSEICVIHLIRRTQIGKKTWMCLKTK